MKGVPVKMRPFRLQMVDKEEKKLIYEQLKQRMPKFRLQYLNGP
jgi:hypothetical protein